MDVRIYVLRFTHYVSLVVRSRVAFAPRLLAAMNTRTGLPLVLPILAILIALFGLLALLLGVVRVAAALALTILALCHMCYGRIAVLLVCKT